MLTALRIVVMNRAFMTVFLCAASGVQAGDLCGWTPSNFAETAICTDYHLNGLDKKLNSAYSLVRESVSDKTSLRDAQLKWLRLVRDRCDSKECLSHVYEKRVAELSELFISSVRLSENPLSNDEAEETCTALASMADNGRLADLAIPGKDQWRIDEKSATAEWIISSEEKVTLGGRGTYWSNEPKTVYRLRLTDKDDPIRFASFSTGGTCPSYKVFSVPYLLNSKGEDVGVDNVRDPDQTLRWAYWGGGDYPIFYRGRYFMITADISNPNHIKLISWIKPDGRKRPLCLLSSTNTKMKVVSAKSPELCSGVANGNLKPLKWKSNKGLFPFRPGRQSYRDEFEKRYGDYADKVDLLSIDIDSSGMAKNIGRFEYASGAGCGSTRVWLSVLSDDLGTVEKSALNNQLKKITSGSMNIYQIRDRYYIAATLSNAEAGVVQVANGQIEQVCEFRYQTKTAISKFFDIEHY